MKYIKFLGASGTVTGSCYLLKEDNGPNVLVDMGMFQGQQEIADLNYAPLQFDPSNVYGVILTHAHLDHCGRLPLLTKNGFKGRIFMTEATKDLTEIALLDAAHISDRIFRNISITCWSFRSPFSISSDSVAVDCIYSSIIK